MKHMSARKSTFSDQTRYNWGYHDAIQHASWPGFVAEWRRGPVDRHFDKAYVRGYYAGMDAAKGAE